MFSKEFINKINEDPILFLIEIDAKILIKFIKYANKKYHNNEAIISDEIFDICIDLIKEVDPDNKIIKQIGAKIVSKNKITLPYTMFSMDKIKATDINVIDKWKTEFNGPYVCSDKLDGVSALLVYTNNKLSLYTRGDGYIGSDISYLISYLPTISNIDISNLPDNIAIRGELIISKINFKKYSEMANARNMVSGIVNAKKINPTILLDIEFIAYELINPWINLQLEQFKILSNYGFKVVHFIKNINIDFNNLSLILIDRKTNSNYELDGIIISNNVLSTRTINNNPEYAFAYKDTTLMESADTEVIEVEWNISKDGYIKPKLKIKPVKLSGVIISNVTAYNAKYIVDNVLGPGSIITLIRSGDVIPKIIKIIKPALTNKPQLPNLDYKWNDTNVDIIINNTLEQTIKELTFFFKKLNILNIDSAIVNKMIKVGIDSIDKILLIEKTDLEQVEGFKKKMIDKIYNNIQLRINKLTLLDLMIASNAFGHGLGERKLTKITEHYPDIIQLYSNYLEDEIIEKIKNIDGFDTKTAEYFSKGLDVFFTLFNKLKPNMRKQLRQSILIAKEKLDIIKDDNKFINKIFVFSGFRNKNWEEIIINNGGKIGSSISSNTSILIINEFDNSSAKVLKAKKLNIHIITKNEFESIYMI